MTSDPVLAVLARPQMSPQERAALELLRTPMQALLVLIEVQRHITRLGDVPVIAWRSLATAVEDGALDKRMPDGRPAVAPGLIRMVRIACSLGGGTSVDLCDEMGGLDRHEAIEVAIAVAAASTVDLRQRAEVDLRLIRESL